MKLIWKLLAFLTVAAIVCFVGLAGWLYLYTADLPPITQLQEFNPVSESEARLRICDSSESIVRVVPFDKFGPHLLPAVKAAEGEPDPFSPFHALIADLRQQRHVGRYSSQLARTMVCQHKALPRALEVVRVANAIERKFNEEQVLAIYLNRVYLGGGAYGVEAGANHYFGRHASDLSLSQAALLASLIRSPSLYSPNSHPERATQRRNLVIDELAKNGTVPTAEAEVAKASGLSLVQSPEANLSDR
jgi:penicillin-binding protein 1A